MAVVFPYALFSDKNKLLPVMASEIEGGGNFIDFTSCTVNEKGEVFEEVAIMRLSFIDLKLLCNYVENLKYEREKR